MILGEEVTNGILDNTTQNNPVFIKLHGLGNLSWTFINFNHKVSQELLRLCEMYLT